MRYATRCMLCLSMAVVTAVVAGCGGRDKPGASTATAGSSPQAAAPASAAIAEQPRLEGAPAEAAIPGRFEIVANAQTRGGPFLLDTQTGRIWQLKEFAGLQGSPVAWHEMTIIDDRGRMGITSTQFQKLYPPRGSAPPRAEQRRHR